MFPPSEFTIFGEQCLFFGNVPPSIFSMLNVSDEGECLYKHEILSAYIEHFFQCIVTYKYNQKSVVWI